MSKQTCSNTWQCSVIVLLLTTASRSAANEPRIFPKCSATNCSHLLAKTTIWSILTGNSPDTKLWTDDTGQYSVYAKFNGLGARTVALRRLNGNHFSVPFARLSKTSQEQAVQLARIAGPTATLNDSIPPEVVPVGTNPFAPTYDERVTMLVTIPVVWLLMAGIYHWNSRRGGPDRGLSKGKAAVLLVGSAITVTATYWSAASLLKTCLMVLPLIILCLLDSFDTSEAAGTN